MINLMVKNNKNKIQENKERILMDRKRYKLNNYLKIKMKKNNFLKIVKNKNFNNKNKEI